MKKWRLYTTCKPSGIEWLGEIPEHWKITPIRAFAMPGYKTFTDGDWIESPYIRDEGIRLIQTGNIGTGLYKEQGFRYIDEETFKQFRCTEVQPNDILICRLAEPVGRACLAPELGVRMITSVDVCILKTKENVDPCFVVYALSHQGYLSWMNSICRGGTRDRVSRSMLGSIRIQKPPLVEQRAIAAFLDRETARIDALIEKKERQIELLQEKRAAVISHVVTKGLDPNVRMKDSGIEWLGEIPEHWKVRRLKYTASINDEALPETTDPGYEFNYVDIGNVDPVKGIVAKQAYRFENAPSRARRIVRDGDTIVSTVRTYLRAIAPIREPEDHLIVSTGFAVIRPRRIDPDYLSYALRSPYFIETVVSRSTGVSYPAINATDVGTIELPIPATNEQRAIAAFLDRETAKIDALVEKIKKSIELLREYRTALITAAVTGKIDVREEVV